MNKNVHSPIIILPSLRFREALSLLKFTINSCLYCINIVSYFWTCVSIHVCFKMPFNKNIYSTVNMKNILNIFWWAFPTIKPLGYTLGSFYLTCNIIVFFFPIHCNCFIYMIRLWNIFSLINLESILYMQQIYELHL